MLHTKIQQTLAQTSKTYIKYEKTSKRTIEQLKTEKGKAEDELKKARAEAAERYTKLETLRHTHTSSHDNETARDAELTRTRQAKENAEALADERARRIEELEKERVHLTWGEKEETNKRIKAMIQEMEEKDRAVAMLEKEVMQMKFATTGFDAEAVRRMDALGVSMRGRDVLTAQPANLGELQVYITVQNVIDLPLTLETSIGMYKNQWPTKAQVPHTATQLIWAYRSIENTQSIAITAMPFLVGGLSRIAKEADSSPLEIATAISILIHIHHRYPNAVYIDEQLRIVVCDHKASNSPFVRASVRQLEAAQKGEWDVATSSLPKRLVAHGVKLAGPTLWLFAVEVDTRTTVLVVRELDREYIFECSEGKWQAVHTGIFVTHDKHECGRSDLQCDVWGWAESLDVIGWYSNGVVTGDRMHPRRLSVHKLQRSAPGSEYGLGNRGPWQCRVQHARAGRLKICPSFGTEAGLVTKMELTSVTFSDFTIILIPQLIRKYSNLFYATVPLMRITRPLRMDDDKLDHTAFRAWPVFIIFPEHPTSHLALRVSYRNCSRERTRPCSSCSKQLTGCLHTTIEDLNADAQQAPQQKRIVSSGKKIMASISILNSENEEATYTDRQENTLCRPSPEKAQLAKIRTKRSIRILSLLTHCPSPCPTCDAAR